MKLIRDASRSVSCFLFFVLVSNGRRRPASGNGLSEAGTWQRWAHARDGGGMGRVYTSGLVVIVVVVIKQLKHTAARGIEQLCGVMTVMDVARKVCARGGSDLLGKSGPSGKWNRQLALGPPARPRPER